MMTGEEFQEAIDKLFAMEDRDSYHDFNQRKTARFLGMTDRNIRRFVAGEKIPRAVVLLLRLMLRTKTTPSKVLKIAKIELQE